jgi:hypothetical protein
MGMATEKRNRNHPRLAAIERPLPSLKPLLSYTLGVTFETQGESRIGKTDKGNYRSRNRWF